MSDLIKDLSELRLNYEKGELQEAASESQSTYAVPAMV